MPRLSVNVNKIATLRNTRYAEIPSIVRLAALALDAGAHGITVHPRPDQRHIRPGDVDALAELLKSYPTAEYCIEGNPFHGLIEHCIRVRPVQALLVPDEHTAFTSNHGWDLLRLDPATRRALGNAIRVLHGEGIRVSLFVDPIPELMPLVRELGAERVELYTEPYAAAAVTGKASEVLERYARATHAARDCDLGVNAGHDLNLQNLAAFLKATGRLDEVSIGHALIADALEFGIAEATRRYLTVCQG
ncbi:MAG TPA: pyridoxine 5'-phosphate synthase [Polyangiaceae bacterium]|nr:pyridoxine 5'-phosphate synthase [Polyangiaceae bacterium]